MSHNPNTTIDCPNCGHPAQYNYCAQCGQPTHLHKDTFWGLLLHFVAHYFHYDSKFWNTIKTLWTKPGALTIAYRKKQRMRFIDPISLYIFISAVFFLCFFSLSATQKHMAEGFREDRRITITADSLETDDGLSEAGRKKLADTAEVGPVLKQIRAGVRKMARNDDALIEFVLGFIHRIPKMMFFLIPLLAFVLKALFIRRKDTFYVEHGIFALHYHAFWFSLMLIAVLNPIEYIDPVLNTSLIVSAAVYFVVALKNVYNVSIGKSIFYSILIGFSYLIIFLIVAISNLMYLVYQIGGTA